MQNPRKIKFMTFDPKKAGKAGQPYISTTAMDARYANPPATAMAPGGPSPAPSPAMTAAEAVSTDKNISYIKEYFFTGNDASKIISYIKSDRADKDVLKFITDNFGKQAFSTHALKTIDTSIDEVIDTDSHVITYNPDSTYVFVYKKNKPLIAESYPKTLTEAEDLAKRVDDPDYIPNISDVEAATKVETPEVEKPEPVEEPKDEAKPEEPETDVEPQVEMPVEPKAEVMPSVEKPIEVSKIFKKGDSVYFVSKNKEKIRGKIEELVTTQADSWYNFVSDDGEVDLWTKSNTFSHISSAIVKPTVSLM